MSTNIRNLTLAEVNNTTVNILFGVVDAGLAEFCPPEALGTWTVGQAREYLATHIREEAVASGLAPLN